MLENSQEKLPITAIVTAYQRIEQTIYTLNHLKNCSPPPAEIVVHVDGGQDNCANAIRQKFPDINVLLSAENLGPGGGRNKLIAAASYEYVASFDDDSYPIDADYFDRVIKLFTCYPDASIICAKVYHQGEKIIADSYDLQWTADFSGGACIYRKEQFLSTSGYVPLAIAYGMEEVDLAIRLHAQGGKILRTDWLRIFHDTSLERHADPRITSVSIANIALLVFLRYPVLLWSIGFFQLLKRIVWLLSHNRSKGIITGIWMTPQYLWQHRDFRKTVSLNIILSYLALRRKPCLILKRYD